MSKFFELAMKFCANSLLLCRTNFHREFPRYLVDGLILKKPGNRASSPENAPGVVFSPQSENIF
jgi:hypothetical protein